MNFVRLSILCLFVSLSISFTSCTSQPTPYPSWTHFRGDQLNGISSEKSLPIKWDDTTNIAWKTAIPGKGWSSPLVLGNQVWITTATAGGMEMRAICTDFGSGEILHNILLFQPDSLYRIHAVNSYATPTGALEEGRVFVHFGRYGTACLDAKTGERIWERTDMQVEHIQGPGSSLLIYKDKLIVHMEGSDIQYIAALDKFTGETLWKTHRPKDLMDRLGYIGKKAYITPIIVEVDGRDLMISNGSAVCIAYDPDTGREVWRIVHGEDSTIAMPTESEGVVYFYAGFETDSAGNTPAELFAVDPSGKGDVEESHVIWRQHSPMLQLLSPIVVDQLFYTIDSKSTLHCLEAGTGKAVWSERMKGKYNASPVYADGHLYFCSTRGECYVMKAGREAIQVAQNKMEGEIWASPAIAGGSLIIRTSEYLYKITAG